MCWFWTRTESHTRPGEAVSLKSGESAKTFHRVNGRIDMIREMTGEDGSLDKLLPTGAYMLEISKGSEYIILMEEVRVTETEMTKSFRLERFVHLGEQGLLCRGSASSQHLQ